MELELSKDLVQKIRNRVKLTGNDYNLALAKWNEIRKSFGISPKKVDCCKGSQANMLKTLNNYYDNRVIEPEILKPYAYVEFVNAPEDGVKSVVLDIEDDLMKKNVVDNHFKKFEVETPRQKADRLGLKYHPNISDKKLIIKIEEHENSK